MRFPGSWDPPMYHHLSPSSPGTAKSKKAQSTQPEGRRTILDNAGVLWQLFAHLGNVPVFGGPSKESSSQPTYRQSIS